MQPGKSVNPWGASSSGATIRFGALSVMGAFAG